MGPNFYRVVYAALDFPSALTFYTKYQINIVNSSLNFSLYQVGMEISGVAHQYFVTTLIRTCYKMSFFVYM